MCLRFAGSAICCCLECGLKLLFTVICSVVGVIIILALIIYFVFFHNKSDGDKASKALENVFRDFGTQ